MTALPGLPTPLFTAVALLMVLAVVALVAWALHLMQAANDRQEFSLMLAGCMVCSAAVGLATVMVLTLTGPDHHLVSAMLASPDQAGVSRDAGVSLDAIVLPWDG